MTGKAMLSSLSVKRRRAGFTMVELLVVVGIIVLLIGITVPFVNKARKQADRTKCANNLKSLGQAVIAFAGEHNGTLPTCGAKQPKYPNSTDWVGYGGIDTTNASAKTDYMNESGLAKYLGTPTPLLNGVANEKLRDNYRCPGVADAVRVGRPFPYDYAFNAQLSGMPLDRVEKGGTKGMIVESDTRDDSAYCYWKAGGAGYPNGTATGVDTIAVVHGGTGGNCLYADGHVDLMDKSRENENATAGMSAFSYWDATVPPVLPPVAPYTFQPKNTGYGAAK